MILALFQTFVLFSVTFIVIYFYSNYKSMKSEVVRTSIHLSDLEHTHIKLAKKYAKAIQELKQIKGEIK